MTMFQPMPDLSTDQYAALKANIEANGILVPIIVDQHGRILDGHNRSRIAAELGIELPRETNHVTDDDEAEDLAVALNCARRHLTRDQTREVIAREIQRRPDDSDRAIARRVGCSPSTVGTVRRGGVSNLDTPFSDTDREALRASEAQLESGLKDARAGLYALVGLALTNGVTVPECVAAVTMARMNFERNKRDKGAMPETIELFRTHVFDYVTEVTTWPETLEQYPVHPDADPTPEERADLIENIVSLGDAEHPADSVTPQR
jgi:ParB-like chromosome segregation protein Spo0J